MTIHHVRNNNKTTGTTHELKDRQLFDLVSNRYCLKDLLPAQREARRHRLEQSIKAIPISSRVSILDVGCGAGFSAEYLRGRYSKYWGIDYSDGLIRYAKAHHSGETIQFHAINVKNFRIESQFDIILATGLLHHLDEVASVMEHLVGLLRPGGWIVANEPNAGNPFVCLARAIRKRIDEEYSCDQVEFTTSQLSGIFEDAGLEAIRMIPQGILSTPFAEVIMPFQKLAAVASRCACSFDRRIEASFGPFLRHVTWNIVATGRKPNR